jgi:S1-C subfamily serine protease
MNPRHWILLLSLFQLADVAVAANPPQSQSAPAPERSFGYLGIEYRWLQHAPREPRFLYIERVAPGGPAERGGIRPGDILTHLANAPSAFGDELDFILFLSERRPGERMPVTFVRNGKVRQTTVILGTLPDAARPAWEEGLKVAKARRLSRRPRRP